MSRRAIRTFRASIAVILVAHASVAAQAHAEPADESASKEGVELRRSGRDAEALAVFERALAVDGSPRTRAQVALAEQALGFWVAAERELSTSLEAGAGPWFAEHRSTLRSALETIRDHLASLDVESNVLGAELWVDGERAGTAPLASPLRVTTGTVKVEVRAEGFATQTRTLQLSAKTYQRVVFELSKVLPVATPKKDDRESLAATPKESQATPHEIGVPTVAWASLASAVALSAGGLAAILVRESNAAVYDDDGRCFYGGLTRDQRCGGYREVASTAQTIGIVEFGAALVATGVSVFFFAQAKKADMAPVGQIHCKLGVTLQCGSLF